MADIINKLKVANGITDTVLKTDENGIIVPSNLAESDIATKEDINSVNSRVDSQISNLQTETDTKISNIESLITNATNELKNING